MTRRERFLGEMEAGGAVGAAGGSDRAVLSRRAERGRPPLGVELMLRVYFLQQWYALADEALEDALYDSRAMRAFVGGDLVPDATTLLKFRHLLERHDLTQRLFAEVNALLAERGAFLREGTIVDATIIAAAPSTKNKAKERDPRDAPDQEGQRVALRHEGAHRRGPGQRAGPHGGGHGGQRGRCGPSPRAAPRRGKGGLWRRGLPGRGKARRDRRRVSRHVRWFVAAKRGKIKAMAEGKLKELTQALEKAKAQLRAYVEHPFHVVKNLFRHRKVRYRGLGQEHGATPHALCLGQPGARPTHPADMKPGHEQPKPSANSSGKRRWQHGSTNSFHQKPPDHSLNRSFRRQPPL